MTDARLPDPDREETKAPSPPLPAGRVGTDEGSTVRLHDTGQQDATDEFHAVAL